MSTCSVAWRGVDLGRIDMPLMQRIVRAESLSESPDNIKRHDLSPFPVCLSPCPGRMKSRPLQSVAKEFTVVHDDNELTKETSPASSVGPR